MQEDWQARIQRFLCCKAEERSTEARGQAWQQDCYWHEHQEGGIEMEVEHK